MRDETIAAFLRQLAARVPAPGGGSTAALHAAQAAALIAMVARYSDGPRYDADTVGRVLAAADGLVDEALGLGQADESAFGKVTEAYQLPRQTPEEKQARAAAIAVALGGAARPPAALLAASARIIGLAEDLLPTANHNLIGDLAAAAASVRAAAEIARINIEENVPGVRDPAVAGELTRAASGASDVIDRADELIANVREGIPR